MKLDNTGMIKVAPNIFEKVLKNGMKCFYVKFKYEGKNKITKNFTKLFGCNTLKQTQAKLQEVKIELSKGKNLFISKSDIINDLWTAYLKRKNYNTSTLKVYTIFYSKWISHIIGKKRIHKVTIDDIRTIQNNLQNFSPTQLNRLKCLLNPIFVEELENGVIDTNPLAKLKGLLIR